MFDNRLLNIKLHPLLQRLPNNPVKLKKKLEDTLGVEFLQPTVRTPLIHCEYFLKVKAIYNGGLGCEVSSPVIIIPITIGLNERTRATVTIKTKEDEFDTHRSHTGRTPFSMLSTDRPFGINRV